MSLPAQPPEALALAVGVRLRAVREEDWVVDWALSRDPAVMVGTTLPYRLSESQARQRVARAIERRAAGESARFAVEQNGELIGLAGVAARPDGDVEVYYALLPAGRGRGIAAAAAHQLADWAHAAGVARVVLVTYPANEASQHTARRAGFVPIGRERGRDDDETSVILWRYRPQAHDRSDRDSQPRTSHEE